MRDADLQLYDAACQLLVAARSLHESAADPDSAAVIAPTLGCLQAGLQEVELAVTALGAHLWADDPASAQRLRGALDQAVAVLRLSRRAFDAARAAAAEVVVAGLDGANEPRRRCVGVRRTRPRRPP